MTFDQFMVGGLLQETRIEKNITQAQMAEALDVSLPHYAKIEQGTDRMSMKLLYKIMTVLDVDANTILLYGEKGNRRLKSIIARLSELDESDQNIVLDNFEYMVGSFNRFRQIRKVD